MRRETAFCATRSGIGALARPPVVRLGAAVASVRGWILPLIFSLLFGLTLSSASGLAAPITGETEPELGAEPASPLTLQDPTAPAVEPSSGGDADATVIEFSIVPSASDPNKMETVIIVQQGGGKNICLNQSTSDIISRNYLRRGDAPFDPAIGGEIRGLSSGDSGELVGFNDIKVFIRPHSSADEFTDTDECFRVAEVEACFVANGADCDQPLQEGDFFCVGDGISNSGCSVTELEHANSMRRMRIMVTLNQPVEEAPIITEAGLPDAPELALPSDEPSAEPEEPSEEPAAEPVPEAPPPPDDPFISDEPPPPPPPPEPPPQVAVPDVFGRTLAEATGIITGVGLVVGNVTIPDQHAGSLMPSLIRSAHAQHCVPGTVEFQTPAAGTLVSLGTQVHLVLCAEPAAIPEPSSLVLFAVGLGLLILFTWSRRRLR